MDDTWLDDETFIQHMAGLLEEKLYSHDQKKIVQRVEMGKEDEQALQRVQ